MSNGHTFKLNVNRGDAWKRIKQATVTLDEQLRRRCAPPWYTPPSGRGRPLRVGEMGDR